MNTTRILGILALAAISVGAPPALGGRVEYTFTIDGGTDFTSLTPGNHSLEIWGQVFDNEIDGPRNGGLLFFSLNINTSNSSAIEFAPYATGDPPVADGTWDSTFEAPLSNNFRGIFGGNDYDVYAHTGTIHPGAHGDHPFTIGSGQRTLLTSGSFQWSGDPATLEVTPFSNVTQLIFGPRSWPDGSLGATTVESASGMTAWLGVPEPASLAMLLALLVGHPHGVRRRH